MFVMTNLSGSFWLSAFASSRGAWQAHGCRRRYPHAVTRLNSGRQDGAVLIVVLVFLTAMSLFGLNSMRGGVVQMKIAQNGHIFNQLDQAAESSVDCVLSEDLNIFVLASAEKRLGPRLALSASQAQAGIDGCGATNTAAPVKRHGFNGIAATTYTEYCGKRPSQLNAVDVEKFQSYQFQTTGHGYFPPPMTAAVGVQQSWRLLMPNDTQRLPPIIQQADANGDIQVLSHHTQCSDSVFGG